MPRSIEYYFGSFDGALLLDNSKPRNVLGFLKSAPFILAIYGAVYLLFMSHRIVLTEEKVSLTSFLNPPQQIKISKIVESRVVGGFGGAKSLNIYSKRFEGWEEPALSIPFTPFKKEDIEWLLGLPELRLNDETF